MKIAMTGASGYIGSHIIEFLGNKKFEITCITRNKNNIAPSKSIRIAETDYTIDSLKKIINGHDCVFHLASSLVQGDNYFTDYIQNVSITNNLFEACHKVGISNIIFTSSRCVYSPVFNEVPFRTNDKIECATNYYGLSKYFCEKLAISYNMKYGMRIKCLRIGQVLGHKEKGGKMAATFISSANEKKALTIYGSGTGKKHFIYVKDIPEAIVKAMNSESTKTVFNIGMSRNYSIIEFANLVNEVFDNKQEIKFKEYQNEDKSEYFMDLSDTKVELNWIPKYDLELALKDIKNIINS